MFDHWLPDAPGVRPSDGTWAWVYNEDRSELSCAVADSNVAQGWRTHFTGITHYWIIAPPDHLPGPQQKPAPPPSRVVRDIEPGMLTGVLLVLIVSFAVGFLWLYVVPFLPDLPK